MATGKATATKSLSVLNSWEVERYARFVSDPVTNSLIPQRSKAGSWKVNYVNCQYHKIYGDDFHSCFQVIRVVK